MKIKEYRQASGLTQKEFSELFNPPIPINTIKKWDCGLNYPPEWAEMLIIEKLKDKDFSTKESNQKSIKDSRISAGLTQKQFSELFEIPIDVIKSWDSGRRKPPEWAEKLIIEKLEQMKER